MTGRLANITAITRRAALALGVFAALGLSAGGARALDQSGAEGFVTGVVSDMRGIIDSGDAGAAGAARFLSLLEAKSSVDAVARFAMGRTWADMSEAQTAAYQDAFRAYISETYQKRFSEYAGEDIVVTGSVDAGKKGVLVKSVLKRPGAEDIDVEWLVSDRSGSVRVSDVLFEGVSLAITLRETFGGMIEKRNGDVDQFIADLKTSGGA